MLSTRNSGRKQSCGDTESGDNGYDGRIKPSVVLGTVASCVQYVAVATRNRDVISMYVFSVIAAFNVRNTLMPTITAITIVSKILIHQKSVVK